MTEKVDEFVVAGWTLPKEHLGFRECPIERPRYPWMMTSGENGPFFVVTRTGSAREVGEELENAMMEYTENQKERKYSAQSQAYSLGYRSYLFLLL